MLRQLMVLLLLTSCFGGSDNKPGLEVLLSQEKSKSFYDSDLIKKINEIHATVTRKGKFTDEQMDFIADVYSRPIPMTIKPSKTPNGKYLANMYTSTRDIRFLQLLFTFSYNHPKDQNARNGLADIYSALPRNFLSLLATQGDDEKEKIMDQTAEGLKVKYVGKLTMENAKFFIVQGSVELYEPTYEHSPLAVNLLADVQKKL